MLIRNLSPFYLLTVIIATAAYHVPNDENLLQLGLVNSIQKRLEANVASLRKNAQYDFIIVGAGAAGCALANRLTENPNWTVLLLEAGGYENYFHQVPLTALALQSTHSNWNYKSVAQNNSCLGMNGRQCALPHGKILGGSSSISLMIYNRGSRQDFDKWAEAGATGWSYAEVLPYFLKSENANLVGLEQSPYHNHSGGPLSVEWVRYRTQFSHTFVRAAQEAGHPKNDYNGESQLGVSYVQATTRDGRRHSGYSAYIQPIRGRRNLHILPFTRVTRVLIDPATKSAYGVEFLHRRKMRRIRARKEVILSAGSFNSPQLLMLSGIGPEDNLKAIEVPLIQNLPVGKRMYDHMSFGGLVFVTNTTRQTISVDRLTLEDTLRFSLQHDSATVLSSLSGMEALAFLKDPSNSESKLNDAPDIELLLMAGSFASAASNEFTRSANIKNEIYDRIYAPLVEQRRDHFTIVPVNLQPKSVGRLWLRTRNPLEWPVIDPNYFSDPADVETLLAGIKEAIRITGMPAMKKIDARLWDVPLPGCEQHQFASDDYWRCSIRTLSYTLHHQVATCRMGAISDPTTVVNAQLKVHGIRKLRVVDTSIVPFPPTAHTNAMAFMIGEKAADLIRNEWSSDCTTYAASSVHPNETPVDSKHTTN